MNFCVALMGAFTLFFLAGSLIYTVYFDLGMESDLAKYSRENLLVLIPLCALLLALVLLLRQRIGTVLDKRDAAGQALLIRQLTCVVLALTGAAGLYLIFAAHAVPHSDAMQLEEIIEAIRAGDYSGYLPGGYLYSNPFQIGYVVVGMALHRLFSPSVRYIIYQLLNLTSILVTEFLLIRMAQLLSDNVRITLNMILLTPLMLYLTVYSVYLYGDIWSLAPETAALYLMLRYVLSPAPLTDRRQCGRVIGAAVLQSFAIFVKPNSEIAVAAICLFLVLWSLRISGLNLQGLIKILVPVLLMILLPRAFLNLAASHYAHLAGLASVPEGAPMTGWIAMGLQENEFEIANGWYNGYNYAIWKESGYNHDAASAVAVAYIRERVSLFLHHPRYAFVFFARKLFSMWAEPALSSMHELELTSRQYGQHGPLIHSIIFGTGRTVLIQIMNAVQSLLYMLVCAAVYAFFRARKLPAQAVRTEKSDHAEDLRADLILLPVLFILGGMSFHLFWEADGRYVVRYYNFLFLLSAAGLEQVSAAVQTLLRRFRTPTPRT